LLALQARADTWHAVFKPTHHDNVKGTIVTYVHCLSSYGRIKNSGFYFNVFMYGAYVKISIINEEHGTTRPTGWIFVKFGI
jgi:hypothetical protein